MSKPIRIAVIGCGAISQQWHIPILAGSEEFTITALADYNTETLNSLKDGYKVALARKDYRDLPLDAFDAVVIATPVMLHFSIAKYFLENNKHVLVEKPIALTLNETNELVALAKQQSLTLSVGLYRRLYPSISLLKQIVSEALYGKVTSFDFNWGGVYSWGATSLGNMKKELAGGGVLMDLGPHALDWLTFIFGENINVLEYKDDSKGGIDADCECILQFNDDDNVVTGSLKLSRIRDLGGELTIHCEQADLSVSVGERFKVEITPKADNTSGVVQNLQLHACDSSQEQYGWDHSFRLEFEDFAQAINHSTTPVLSGESVVAAMHAIDQCYSNVTHNELAWESTLPLFSQLNEDVKKVLVTGASGFIGGRVCEALCAGSEHVQVIAAVNNPSNASRLSRLNTEMIQLDITDESSVEAAVAGCDAIIHCAIGTSYGDDALIRRVTVDGTQNLLTAAKHQHVKKFIHISSLAVIDPASQQINEASPLAKSNELYTQTKQEAEKIVQEAACAELMTVILRPSNVYGPYSALFKVGAGAQLINAAGITMSQQAESAPANVVYVDNVVEAVIKAINTRNLAANGQCYFIDDNTGTFGEFFGYFCKKLHKDLHVSTSAGPASSASKGGLLGDIKGIAKSKKTKAFLKQFYDGKSIGKLPRMVFERYPALADKFKNTDPVIYKKAGGKRPSLITVEPYTTANIDTTKLIAELDFKPIVKQSTGLSLTYEWLKFSKNLNEADE